ncbi:PQQ-binding-like beta-propeller repeat protein [Haloferax sp. MBLA0076]|uniref:PQQ-binding-like beta-propeller repeat protein n=1 Tax=Haloferax litoreum TaxID=2666140 RepID=A0A6A8GFX8_9EURY|nr:MULTISPECIES: PQQ-binding-like beta-propeller repeat protein [Haloferax]KAB1193732.1 PQQ-binding-like beta-propeller repeat protein [Haloferax sp. CBA1148]MRX22264.1 PQQ-binding-like beta-propeller repeat protein [Haloferax litoreum]
MNSPATPSTHPTPSERGGPQSRRTLRRRDLLQLVGSGVLTGLAGCLGGDDSVDDDDLPEGTQFDADWPTYAQDDANTAFLDDGRAVSDPVVEYEADFGMPTWEPAAIGSVAYTASDPIHVVDAAAGEEVEVVPGDTWATPAVLDGSLYSSGITHHGPRRMGVYHAETGRDFRSIELPARPTTAPTFSNDRETMFLGLRDERICAVDLDSAEVKWTRELFGDVHRPLAVNLGFVFVVTEGQRLYCLGTDGSGYWQAALETAEPVAPVVGDERVYIAGWDRIAALEKRNGSVVWEDDEGVHKRLALDGERLYVSRGDLRALDTATGEERWSYSPNEGTSAASVVDDTVYVGTGAGELVALKRDGNGLAGSRERWTISLGTYVGHSFACTDRRVFCPVIRDDGLMSLTVVADASVSGAGTTATAGGEAA